MTNEQLVAEVQQGQNRTSNLEQLFTQNLPLIKKTVMQFQGVEETEDLIQEAFIALCGAAEGYDPEEGNSFMTYAVKVIRGRLQTYIANNSYLLRLPRYKRDQVNRLRRISEDYTAKHGRQPSETYLLITLGITIEDLRQLQTLSQGTTSLDSSVTDTDSLETSITLADTIADPLDLENDVIDRISEDREKALLWGAVCALPADESRVIQLHYRDRISVTDLAEHDGLTPQEVKKTELSGIRKLRRNRDIKREFSAEIPDSKYYVGGLMRFRVTWTSTTERLALENLN